MDTPELPDRDFYRRLSIKLQGILSVRDISKLYTNGDKTERELAMKAYQCAMRTSLRIEHHSKLVEDSNFDLLRDVLTSITGTDKDDVRIVLRIASILVKKRCRALSQDINYAGSVKKPGFLTDQLRIYAEAVPSHHLMPQLTSLWYRVYGTRSLVPLRVVLAVLLDPAKPPVDFVTLSQSLDDPFLSLVAACR